MIYDTNSWYFRRFISMRGRVSEKKIPFVALSQHTAREKKMRSHIDQMIELHELMIRVIRVLVFVDDRNHSKYIPNFALPYHPHLLTILFQIQPFLWDMKKTIKSVGFPCKDVQLGQVFNARFFLAQRLTAFINTPLNHPETFKKQIFQMVRCHFPHLSRNDHPSYRKEIFNELKILGMDIDFIFSLFRESRDILMDFLEMDSDKKFAAVDKNARFSRRDFTKLTRINAITTRNCSFCGVTMARWSGCPCKKAYYCCKDHQVQHWKVHRKICSY